MMQFSPLESKKTIYALFVFFLLGLGLSISTDQRISILTLIFLLFYILLRNGSNRFLIGKSFLLTFTPLIVGGFFPNTFWFIPWGIYFGSMLYLTLHIVKGRLPLDIHSLTSANIVTGLLLAISGISKRVSENDLWAWQLRGDAINFIVSIRSLSEAKTTFAGAVLRGEDFGLPVGSSFSVQWFAQQLLNITGGSNRDLSDLGTSFLGINLLVWVIIIISVLEVDRNSGIIKKLLVSVLFLITIFSWINGGLTLYNGFLSVPLSITLIYLSLSSAIFEKKADISLAYLFYQGFLITMLISTWSLVAVVPASIVFFQYIESTFEKFNCQNSKKMYAFRSSMISPLVLFRLTSLVLFTIAYWKILNTPNFTSTLIRSGAFPHLTFLTLAISSMVIIVLFLISKKKTLGNFFYVGTMVPLTSVGLVFLMESENKGSVVRGVQSLWVTETYYLQKAVWIILVSVFFALIASLANQKNFVLGLAFLTFLINQQNTTPTSLMSKAERGIVSYQGIEEIDRTTTGLPIMYFNFDNWLGDAYLISLSGLQFESYSGHPVGPIKYRSTTFMPSDSFSARSFYTDEKNALCVGQSFLGVSGEIRTRDLGLETKLFDWCGKGPFPRVISYAVK